MRSPAKMARSWMGRFFNVNCSTFFGQNTEKMFEKPSTMNKISKNATTTAGVPQGSKPRTKKMKIEMMMKSVNMRRLAAMFLANITSRKRMGASIQRAKPVESMPSMLYVNCESTKTQKYASDIWVPTEVLNIP